MHKRKNPHLKKAGVRWAISGGSLWEEVYGAACTSNSITASYLICKE